VAKAILVPHDGHAMSDAALNETFEHETSEGQEK
jgi:hypothetical protein